VPQEFLEFRVQPEPQVLLVLMELPEPLVLMELPEPLVLTELPEPRV